MINDQFFSPNMRKLSMAFVSPSLLEEKRCFSSSFFWMFYQGHKETLGTDTGVVMILFQMYLYIKACLVYTLNGVISNICQQHTLAPLDGKHSMTSSLIFFMLELTLKLMNRDRLVFW